MKDKLTLAQSVGFGLLFFPLIASLDDPTSGPNYAVASRFAYGVILPLAVGLILPVDENKYVRLTRRVTFALATAGLVYLTISALINW